MDHEIRIVTGFQSAEEFRYLLSEETLPGHMKEYLVRQRDVYGNERHRFILAEQELTGAFRAASARLGDVADVVTGFCSGDNHRFIRALDHGVRGSRNYAIINLSQVYPCSSIRGIEGVSEGYVPYVKGASPERYIRSRDEWFVRWDEETVLYYNRNKKTRFQNPGYYFRTGVAIPMVKASQIRAFLMENRVFDQSIVGIFPKDSSRLYYLLALMNSDVVNNLIHVINPTANNSANYIKQIPYLEPDRPTFERINTRVRNLIQAIRSGQTSEQEIECQELNTLIGSVYASALGG